MAWASVASDSCFSSSAALLAMMPLPRLAADATTRPAMMAVPPVEVLAPVSVSVPAPDLLRSPLPLMACASVASWAWWISSAAWLVMAPLPRFAAEAISRPASMVVAPVEVLPPVSVNTALPDLIRSPLPLMACASTALVDC